MAERKLEPTEARQGTVDKGRPVLWVLIAGLVLGVLYIAGMMLFPATEELPPDPGVVETEQVPNPEEPAGGADTGAGETPSGAPAPAPAPDGTVRP